MDARKMTALRIKEQIEKQNLSYGDLEKMTGISKSTLYRYIAGQDKDMFVGKLKAIAVALNVSPLYLIGISDNESGLQEKNKFIQIPKVGARPDVGWSNSEANGKFEEYFSFCSDWIKAKGDPKSLVLMTVEGDSMEPLIAGGDMVLIDRNKKDLVQNAIYTVRVEDMIYLKYIDRLPGKFILRSYNQLYKPIEMDTKYFDDNSVEILGRVVWWCHDEMPMKVG